MISWNNQGRRYAQSGISSTITGRTYQSSFVLPTGLCHVTSSATYPSITSTVSAPYVSVTILAPSIVTTGRIS